MVKRTEVAPTVGTLAKSNAEYAREWRRRNPEAVARYNRARRTPPTELACVECGENFAGRKDRLLCGRRRCKDARYRRLHPDAYRAKQRRKAQRRKTTRSSVRARGTKRFRRALAARARESRADRIERRRRGYLGLIA